MENFIMVALGDSLTVGFRSSGIDTSYTYYLEQKMVEALTRAGKPFEFKVYNRGINGDLTENMLRRFQRDVVDLKPNCVVVLGGSNDIGWGVSVDEVYDNLRGMYAKALESGIIPVACAVPSILGFDELIPPRRGLNQMIERYCAENDVTFVDLFRATADQYTGRLLEQYSNDGLHLTDKGYMRVAEEIFKVTMRMTRLGI